MHFKQKILLCLVPFALAIPIPKQPVKVIDIVAQNAKSSMPVMPKISIEDTMPLQPPYLKHTLPPDLNKQIAGYLSFDDIISGEVFRHIPEDIVFQSMKIPDIEKPLRYIFQDSRPNLVFHRLSKAQQLESLMKNVEFNSYLKDWDTLTNFVSSYDGALNSLDAQWQIDGFVDWIKASEDSPAKQYLLSKMDNQEEFKQIISRGRWLSKNGGWNQYTPTLPSPLVDTFSKLIRKGDQESALLFDQLISNPIIKKYFIHDVERTAFTDAMVQMSENGGEPFVFLKDEITGSLSVYDFKNSEQKLLYATVGNDRLDILNGLLKKYHGEDFHELFADIYWRILNKEDSFPEYDFKLAKDLLENNIDAIKNSQVLVYDETLRINLLSETIQRDTTPQLRSLVEFMVDLFKREGVDINAEEALQVAMDVGNSDYNDYFMKNLPS